MPIRRKPSLARDMVWDTQDVPIDTDFGPSHQQMENGGQAAMLYLLLRRKSQQPTPFPDTGTAAL
jgi:hypothetical protein